MRLAAAFGECKPFGHLQNAANVVSLVVLVGCGA
jgi:hypothetical protein